MDDENIGDASRKTGSKKLLYGIGAVVVIVILVGIYFVFMSGGGSSEDEVVEKLQPIIDSFEADANSIVENSDNPALAANVLKSNITKIEQNGDNFEISVRFYLDIQTSLSNLLVFTYDGDEGKFTNVTSSGTLFPLPAEMTFEKFQSLAKRLGGGDSGSGDEDTTVENGVDDVADGKEEVLSCSNGEYSAEKSGSNHYVDYVELTKESQVKLDNKIIEVGNSAFTELEGLEDCLEVLEVINRNYCGDDASFCKNYCSENSFCDEIISDLSYLPEFENLKVLYLRKSLVSDLSPLSGFNTLENLDIMQTDVSDLSPLSGLENLEILLLAETPVTDISPLTNFVSLKELYAGETKIDDFSPLADITSLEKLDLEGTSVSDISFISSLNNLNWVNLMSTNVVSVSSLANHPTLKRVELRNNDIVGDCPDMFDSGFENIAIIC